MTSEGSYAEFKPDTAWKTYGIRFKLEARPPAKTLRVELGYGIKSAVTGYLDWSRIELHFK